MRGEGKANAAAAWTLPGAARKCAERLDRAFFGRTDAQTLNLFRFLYCLLLAITIFQRLGRDMTAVALQHHPEVFSPIRLFKLLGIDFVSPGVFLALHPILVTALLFAAAGFLTRWSLVASGVAFFFYFGTIHSILKPVNLDKIGRIIDPVIWVLIILSVSPGIGMWGVDGWLRRRGPRRPPAGGSAGIPAWPTQTVKLLLALIYFGAVYAKLRDSPAWFDGHTLQALFLEKSAEAGGLGFWLANHRWLCSAISIASGIFELAFAAVLFFPSLDWLFCAAGLGMHALIWATMDLNYLQYFCYTYLIFLTWPRLRRAGARIEAIRARLPPPEPAAEAACAPQDAKRRRLAMGFIAAFAVLHLTAIFLWLEAWPIASWRFYPRTKDYTSVVFYRLEEITWSGQRRWSVPDQGSTVVNNKILYALQAGKPAWVEAAVRFFADQLPARKRGEIKAVAVVRRTVRKSSAGRFEYVFNRVMEIELAPRAVAR